MKKSYLTDKEVAIVTAGARELAKFIADDIMQYGAQKVSTRLLQVEDVVINGEHLCNYLGGWTKESLSERISEILLQSAAAEIFTNRKKGNSK